MSKWQPKGNIEEIAYLAGARGYCARCGCYYKSKKEHEGSPLGKQMHPKSASPKHKGSQ